MAKNRLRVLATQLGAAPPAADDGSPMGQGTYIRALPPYGALRIDHGSRPPRPAPIDRSALERVVGQEIGTSGWFEVTQDRVDAFALTTGDPQWIHAHDAGEKGSPFGAPIVHGNLTLCLAYLLATEAMPPVKGVTTGLNYGLNRVRFPSPLMVGASIRATVKVVSTKPVPPVPGTNEGCENVIQVTLVSDGGDKPVCVADLASRLYFA
ncbi:HotDog domain-containing protein [Pavlovales sp. CCMP2436]|nr:HotDog domain-containing protein [Pavlovales sp. CCMP2436]|mmetsp:Transcript_12911/g.32729  ORF Transcript_12911/g.32729 Transcript_12911/m.32729 type:complete len:209 (+) Transcript_12911:109-735(+)